MAISNSQYDAIMREYEKRREDSRHDLESRKAKVYADIPEYKELENRITDIALESATKYFDGDKAAITLMKEEMARILEKQEKLLEAHDFGKDYLKENHVCEDCQDTGYIGQQKCHCLKQNILKVLYKQSNIEEVLKKENFDTLDYDIYDDKDIDMMKGIISECKKFVGNFDSAYENLIIFGNVGVGKTFLTNCITKELIESGHSVIYFTSIRLFDTLSDSVFKKDYDDEDDESDVLSNIFSCDLLIIDDLGTEGINSFVASRLFDVLNERNNREKSTIISTNLNPAEIKDRYSERSFSRIFGNYKPLNPDLDDLRIKKRRLYGI